MLTEDLRARTMFVPEQFQSQELRITLKFFDGLFIRFYGREFTSQEAVTRVDALLMGFHIVDGKVSPALSIPDAEPIYRNLGELHPVLPCKLRG